MDLELIQVCVSGNINRVPTTGSANTSINKHPEIFEERIGQFKDYEVKLHIDSSVKSIALPNRRISFHLRTKVQNEIDQLLEDDVIEKADDPTPWASPIVVTTRPKAPDMIRMCVDMQAANTAIERERHITQQYVTSSGRFMDVKYFQSLICVQGTTS